MTQLISEHHGCNTLCTTIFSKPMVKKHVDVHIRTIVILTGGKLTRIYFLHLLYVIYFSVMTHLRIGKKVSFLPLSDVNPGPIPLR
jgi:hypothetical protein